MQTGGVRGEEMSTGVKGQACSGETMMRVETEGDETR
jgi:hypothetical protein